MRKSLFFLLIAFCTAKVFSQNSINNPKIYLNSGENKRKALVIGNRDYSSPSSKLQNTLNDADSMKVALEYLGFIVTVLKDADYSNMLRGVDDFMNSLEKNDIALFYFSGHGAAFERENYLIPIDFTSNCISDLKYRAIKVSELSERPNNRGVRNIFLILDACRDTPSELKDCLYNNKTLTKTRFVKPNFITPIGSIISFSTNYENTSTDKSENNYNGLYTESLLKYIRKPYGIRTILDSAKIRTRDFSFILRPNVPLQDPIREDNMAGDFFFIKPENFDINLKITRDSLSAIVKLLDSRDTSIYPRVDIESQFHKGEYGMDKYISDSLKYPGQAEYSDESCQVFQ